MKCDGVTHRLLDIFANENAISSAVVRWCADCGAVVVDEDYDGRTNPGQYVEMLFPNMTYPNQTEKP